jgi:hypothetical protein
MRAVTGASLLVAIPATLAAMATLTACGSAAPPPASGPLPSHTAPAPAVPGPPPGDRAEAAALAKLMLSQLRLPPEGRRLPPAPLPPSLSEPAFQYAGGADYLDLHQLFAVALTMNSVATILAAHVPPGMRGPGTGQGSGPDTGPYLEVDFTDWSLPTGISAAQLVLTIAPAGPGGSLLRADAQVMWYPPRTAAEYIDPARYHALAITVTIYGGRKLRTMHKVVTSRAVITAVAEALDLSQAEPTGTVVCPSDAESYQLAFSVSTRSRPAVEVSATPSSCGGTGITVRGQVQPSVADGGAVAALAGRVFGIAPQS